MQDRIKALRKSLGLTQKDFGERIGVQANTITSYESGVRTPNNSMILAICREYEEKDLRFRMSFLKFIRDRYSRKDVSPGSSTTYNQAIWRYCTHAAFAVGTFREDFLSATGCSNC